MVSIFAFRQVHAEAYIAQKILKMYARQSVAEKIKTVPAPFVQSE